MWLEAFKPILDSLKGETMNIYDDNEVLECLKANFTTYNTNKPNHSKPLRLFRFFRSLKNEGFAKWVKDNPTKTVRWQIFQYTYSSVMILIGYDTNILELEFNSNASVSCIINVYLIDSLFRILTMNNRQQTPFCN